MFYNIEHNSKMMSILSSLITSKTRIRILMRLFLNPESHAYLRELANEFGVSSSQVSEELQQLSDAGFLISKRQGRQINYQANRSHSLFPELHSMVKKALGMDQILESIITRLGKLKKAYLIDDYAEGKDTGLIDLVLIGDIDRDNLNDLVNKTENYIKRKIRTLVLRDDEKKIINGIVKNRVTLLLWDADSETGKQSLLKNKN